jgi:hypothetical protein
VLAINRFIVDSPDFVPRAHAALAALAARPGYQRGQLTRALDEPSGAVGGGPSGERWCLVTEWESVGAYRRALGAYEVKVAANPLLAESLDEPSAYETLASAEPSGDVVVMDSDRAA